MWCTTSNGTKIFLPKKMTSVEKDIINSFSKMTLDSEIDISYKILNRNVSHITNNFVTNINLNFYMIWSLFTILPIVTETHYIYTIQSVNTTNFFTITSKKTDKFINIKSYQIYSSNPDKKITFDFLIHLKNAVDLYLKEYICIEKHIFKSSNEEINTHLKYIKNELLKYKEILNEC